MEKKLIRKTVFFQYLGKTNPKWKDIKNLFEIQDEDFVSIFYEDDDLGSEWFFEVDREEIESDEAYELRMGMEKSGVKRKKKKDVSDI